MNPPRLLGYRARGLRWDDVDLERRLVHIHPSEEWQPKDGDPRSIPVPDSLIGVLGDARASDRLLAAPPVRPRREAAGLTGGPHKLRHAVREPLPRQPPRPPLLANLLGHNDVRVAERVYAHLLPSHREGARNVVNLVVRLTRCCKHPVRRGRGVVSRMRWVSSADTHLRRNRMFTVYFDTAFYVWLARADESAAQRALDALDQMSVRTVLSLTLLQELLSSVGREQADAALHARITGLESSSYRTHEGLSWDALLTKGDARRQFADALASMQRATVQAESLSVLANSSHPHPLKEAAAEQVAAQLPFTLPEGIDHAKLGEHLAPVLGALGIPVPSPLTEQDLPALHDALVALLPPGTMEASATRNRLVASAVATDARPYETILGTASEKVRERLAHTFRDAGGHMAEFVRHSDHIDLFQMDFPQRHQVEGNPEHELCRLGLHTRCFSAKSLETAIAAVSAARSVA